MKKQLSSTFDLLKRTLIDDRTNLHLAITALAVIGLNILIWRIKFHQYAANFSWKLPFSPLEYCIIIGVINLAVSLVTFNNEKEVSHLLLAATTLIAFLVFILEIFYLTHLT